MHAELRDSVVRILKPSGQTAGTGFVVADGLIATCAHVVENARAGPGETVDLVFLPTQEKWAAEVKREYWRDPERQDVAILFLKSSLPDAVKAVLLGRSSGTEDHPIKTFGFPEDKSLEGMPGGGEVVGTTSEAGYPVLSLRSLEITPGFSGAPVLDSRTNRVIGMVTSIMCPDRFGRQTATAFVTPTETLREVCPVLQVSEICPYLGLYAFGEEDASFFFGRRALIGKLLSKLKQEPSFLAVLGPSGSGKSSVVQAGLIPALRQGMVSGSQRWSVMVIRPARNPFEELSSQGLRSAIGDLKTGVREWLERHPECERLVLIIDQFEELFTGCPKPLSQAFLDQLAGVLDSSEPLLVVLTMRDEFYNHFTQEAPGLVGWLERSTANVPSSLTQEDLIEMVQKPAEAVGLRFEADTVASIVKDAMGVGSEEGEERVGRSTILPLLEFALTELWELREDGLLTHRAYTERVGGVAGGLPNWADRELRKLKNSLCFRVALEKERLEQLALRIFTDLVHLGDEHKGIPDTRRRRPLRELWRSEDECQAVQQIVQHLVEARLLVTAQESVEIIHDALLREWGALRWHLKQDRRFLEWRQKIESRVAGWVQTAPDNVGLRDTGKLLRGGDLTEAETWWAERLPDLNEAERSFVEESLSLRERQAAEEEAQRERELERARELEQALARANKQLAVSESQRLAFAARSVSTAPETSLLLACEAVYWDRNPLTEEVLRDALDNVSWRVTTFIGHSKGVNSAVFSHDAQLILTASEDYSARLWGVNGRQLVCFSGHTDSVTCAVFSPDDQRILTTSVDGTARLWQPDGECLAELTYPTRDGYHSGLTRGTFSPDGRLILVCDYNEAWLWDAEGRLLPMEWNARPQLEIMNAAWTTSLSDDQKDDLLLAEERVRNQGHSDRIFSVAFSPDGQRIVTASEDRTARIWDLAGRQLAILRGHESKVVNAVFSPPDGKLILTGSMDKTARLWNADGSLLATLQGHVADVGHLAFTQDGQLMLTAVHGGGHQDPTVRLWDRSGKLAATLRTEHSNWIRGAAFSPDGQRIITGSSDGTARLLDVSGAKLAVFKGHLDRIESVAFSPNGRLILTASDDGTARLWEAVESVLPTIRGHSKVVIGAIYEPEGTHMLTSSLDGTTCLWNTAGQLRVTYSGTANLLDDDVFSPDGQYLLTVESEAGRANLWELPPDLRWRYDAVRQKRGKGTANHTSWLQPPIRSRPSEPNQPVVTFTNPEDATQSFKRAIFSQDGRHVLTFTPKSVQLWDWRGKLLANLTGENLNPREKVTADFAMFSADGKRIVSASINGSVWVWAGNGKPLASFLTDASSARDNLFSVTFSPDGQRILTTIRQSAGLWDLSGRCLAELPCRTNKVKRGLFSPKGDRILTVAEAAIPDVRLWDSEGKLIGRLSATGGEFTPIKFDHEGEHLCIVDQNIIGIWDRDGSLVATLVADRGTWIKDVAFSPDGEHLLTACSSGVAQLWTIAGGGALQSTFKGHTAEVNSAVFSADGKRVLTASSDGTARQFFTEIDDLLACAARRAGRQLDAQEMKRFNLQTPLRFDPRSLSTNS